ncbi:hypothetical protein SJDPG12_00670 [Porphyromonas gingivalis SJD12]|nr:hypothetical protein SJDPG12_00670 [Porphyromonas gingivalis SJD12]
MTEPDLEENIFFLQFSLFLGRVFRIVRKNTYICPRQTATGVLAGKNCDTAG